MLEDEKMGISYYNIGHLDNSKAILELRYRNCWSSEWDVENISHTWIDANCVVYSNWSNIIDPKSWTILKKSKEW